MKLLEDILKEKCEKEDTEILLAQWKYDKELYKDILQNTKDYYCHYTDHGINHSEAVLSNIVRILGIDKIKELSSLDIWLLLEAAYIHDSGMFITREEVEELCKKEEFIKHFKYLKLNTSSDLFRYTQFFEVIDEKLIIKDGRYNSEIEYGLKFIIGDYNRTSHAKRSKIIVNKFNKLKKDNILIPKRINDILFTIAEAHSYCFEDVIKIHYSETGLKLEKCHPRFIACLLRLGDLLDMDNDRFSPVLIDNIKDIIPENSKNHLEKHKSIVHFRIDEKSIEITSLVENCGEASYEIVGEVNEWFEYISKEYNYQLLNWNKIRPKFFTGTLPMLGELKIELKGYDFIENKSKPKFSVDTNNILELLKGSGIYASKETALREIIQNSIDAIFLKVYKENEKKLTDKRELEKDYKKLKEKYLKNEKITINLKMNEKNEYEISIKDTGIGMDKNDLKYLIIAGNSPNNLEKKSLINEMPFWLKPSGNFGIGFQSLFMLTNKVKLKSRKINSEEMIEMDLFSPSYFDKKRGNIFIKRKKKETVANFGTEIIFMIDDPKKEITKKEQILNPRINDLEMRKKKILDEIKLINEYSPIEIEVFYNNELQYFSKKEKNENDWLYVKETGLEIKLDFINKDVFDSKILFKNQRLRDGINFEFIEVYINFLIDEAKDILHVNRDVLKKEVIGNQNFLDKIFDSIFFVIKREYEKDFDKLDEKIKIKLSGFMCYYLNQYKKFKTRYKEEIDEKIQNFLQENSILQKILAATEVKIRGDKYSSFSKEIFIYNLESKGYERVKIEDCSEKAILEIMFRKNKYNAKDDKTKSDVTDSYSYGIILEKIDFGEEEEIESEIFRKKLSIENDDYIDYVLVEPKIKKLKLDLKEFYDNRFMCEMFVTSPGLRSYYPQSMDYLKIKNCRSFYDSEFQLYLGRNLVYFPLEMVEKDIYLWNENLRKKFIDFTYEYRYFKELKKEEIGLLVDEYIVELKKIYNIYPNLNHLSNKNQEKSKDRYTKLLEIFPEIKLDDGEINYDRLKEIIDDKN